MFAKVKMWFGNARVFARNINKKPESILFISMFALYIVCLLGLFIPANPAFMPYYIGALTVPVIGMVYAFGQMMLNIAKPFWPGNSVQLVA